MRQCRAICEFFLRGDNLNLFRGEAEKFKAARGSGPNVLAVFSNASRENEQVYSAEERNIRADHFAHRDCENIEGELGRWVIGPGAPRAPSHHFLRLKGPTVRSDG